MSRKLDIKPLKPAPEIESQARNDRHPNVYTHKLSFSSAGYLRCERCSESEEFSGRGLSMSCSVGSPFLFLRSLEMVEGGEEWPERHRDFILRPTAEAFLDHKYDFIAKDAEGNTWPGYGRVVWKEPMKELYRYAWTYRYMQSFDSQWGQMVPAHVREAIAPNREAFNYHYDAINPETGRRCPKWVEQGLGYDPGEYFGVQNVWLQTELVNEARPDSGGRTRAVSVALTPAQQYWHDKLTEEEREEYVDRIYTLSRGESWSMHEVLKAKLSVNPDEMTAEKIRAVDDYMSDSPHFSTLDTAPRWLLLYTTLCPPEADRKVDSYSPHKKAAKSVIRESNNFYHYTHISLSPPTPHSPPHGARCRPLLS